MIDNKCRDRRVVVFCHENAVSSQKQNHWQWQWQSLGTYEENCTFIVFRKTSIHPNKVRKSHSPSPPASSSFASSAGMPGTFHLKWGILSQLQSKRTSWTPCTLWRLLTAGRGGDCLPEPSCMKKGQFSAPLHQVNGARKRGGGCRLPKAINRAYAAKPLMRKESCVSLELPGASTQTGDKSCSMQREPSQGIFILDVLLLTLPNSSLTNIRELASWRGTFRLSF